MEIRKMIAGLASVIALTQPLPAFAVAQRTGDFELEIDAPWRMEPRANGYGAIPIQISIHDADQPATGPDAFLQKLINLKQSGAGLWDVVTTFLADGAFDAFEGVDEILEWVFGFEILPFDTFPVITLDKFQSLAVYEERNGRWVQRQLFGVNNMHEIERTVGLWQWSPDQTGPESPFAPPPRPQYALCRRWLGLNCTAFADLRPTSEWHATAMYVPAQTAPGSDVRLRVVLRVSVRADGDPSVRTYERILSVHLGEAPLPRFDSRWAYGDLHYHSQGTDNDGESAYSYRGVTQAMGAIGLDFAFATDHASNSPQIGSAAPIPTSELILPIMRGLRDLSPDRFAFSLGLIGNADRQVHSAGRVGASAGSLAVPQLFLGSEVDVVPEAYQADFYGSSACYGLPDVLKALEQKTPFFDYAVCDTVFTPVEGGRGLYRDVQGPGNGHLLSTSFYARQHLLHLPTDGTRTSAFIPSNTSKYGGATRRLGEILDLELAQRQKGYVFLAHPFAQSSGNGEGRVGPDLIPYSTAQLQDAFRSPYVLGLQIWNEDGVRTADADDKHPFDAPHYTGQHMPFDFWDFARWDLIQLWGLDRSRTDALAWLGPNQPRRVFMAGGSDAHGDFNYRREGWFLGTSSVTDTAIGKPRNLVFVGDPAGTPIRSGASTGTPLSQRQVVDGLRTGNFAVTDGPIVRIAYDANRNGQIDDSDIPMGGVVQRDGSAPFNLIVEWRSTPEFGPVDHVDLYLGVYKRGHAEGIVYSPWAARDIDPSLYFTSFPDPSSGRKYVKTPNYPYWFDPTPGTLYVTPFAGEGYAGRRVLTIDPKAFPIGDGVCTSWSTYAVAPGGNTTPPAGIGGGAVALDTSIQQQLEDLSNGIVTDPGPQCLTRAFQNAETPERMFVRAAVINATMPGSNALCSNAPLQGETQCIYRRAYTNPLWVNVNPCTSIQCQTAAPPTGGVLDAGAGGSSTGGSTGGTTGGTTGGVAGGTFGTFATGGFSLVVSP